MERTALRGGWRPLLYLTFCIVHVFGQGNFIFIREKSGNFEK